MTCTCGNGEAEEDRGAVLRCPVHGPEQIQPGELEDAIYDKVFKACRDHGLGSATSSSIANRVVLLWSNDT